MVRAVINEETGRVRELRIAADGDFTKLTRILLDEDGAARVPRDLDGNGAPDRWEYYADARAMASGSVEKVGFSLAGDGVEDAWVFHDALGEVLRVEVSTARDGTVDRWEHYAGGALVRVEADTNGDRRPDRWETYDRGIFVSASSDGDGDGFPDPPPPGEG